MPKKNENDMNKRTQRKFSMSALLKNNRIIFAISLIIAVAIWITVSPNREITLGMTLSVDTSNTTVEQLGLEVIDGLEQHIDVTVSGKWYVISELRDKDIKLSYSLSDVTKAGEYEISLSASKAASNSDYEITKINPEKITVSFDYIYTRSFEIQAQAPNIKAKEGLILDTPVISDNSIISISGPKTIVERIDKVTATVENEATLDNSTSYTVPLKVYNKNGKEESVDKLTMPFTEVSVTVPVSKSKTVPLQVEFTNAPEYYQKNPLKYTMNISSINAVGTPEVIDALDSITVGTIDFSKISPSSSQFTFDLSLPTGVRTIDDVADKITVTLDVSDISTKSVDITSFKVVNAAEDSDISVVTEKKTVTVAGPKSVISSIASSDLYLECDASKYTSKGEFVADSVLRSSKYNNIWSVGSSKYEIQLKAS